MTTPPDIVDATDLAVYLAGTPESIVRQVQATIRSFCGWHVAPELEEELTLDGRGLNHLWLPTLKVKAIASVTDEGNALTSDDFDWSESGYLERRTGTWSTRPRQIVVELTHGYAEIPDDLIGAAVAIAARASSSPSGSVREQTGPFARDFGQVNGVAGGIALLEQEKDILSRYKLPPRP
jgi:hypothetical protein